MAQSMLNAHRCAQRFQFLRVKNSLVKEIYYFLIFNRINIDGYE